MTVPAAEYAFLALRVYNRNAENKGPLPSDWDEIAYLPDDASGFSAGAFRNKLTGEVVISFTGTNERKVADFVNANIPAAGGLYSTQVMKAIEFVSDIRAQEPAADITFTGHSLGGGLASLMATYFDLPATIFDPAPFKNSASRLNASFVGTRSTVLTYLATYVLYQQTTGRPVDSKFLAYGAGFVAGDYNLLYSGRAKNVNGFETTGEVLEGLRDFLPTVVTSLEPVNPGPNTLASDTLHSMALLASLQWSPNFATALRGSQVATDLLFDETLYALHEPAVDPGRDFISDLARNEIGVAGAPNDSGNHLLEHFAHDVIAVTPSSADLLSKTMQSGLVAGVMEFYWEGDFLQTAGEPAEFAELVNGGVHLDFTRTLSSQDKGRHRLADAAVSTVDFSGIAGAGTTDILTALALINSSQSWYIQTQSASPLVITDVGASNANDVILNFRGQAVVHGGGGNDLIVGAKDSYDDTLYGDGGADILMGGGGNDILYGGDDADILVGGGGNDVLVGGAGIDTYILNPGDGFDEIADSGHDGTLVMGGATLSAATWTQFTERGILNPKWYAVVGSKQFTAMFVDWEPVVGAPLGTLTGTLLITEEGMASDVALDDYTMGDFGINLPGGASNTFHAPYYQKALDRLGAIYAESLQTVSPLILDLDGDGVETVSSSAGVHFDHDANGLAEATGWVGADDGLLVRDLNGNGLIDNGHELFGNNTLLPNGTYAGNGFEALKALDSNSDTKISSSDSAFSQLRIWKDANGNGLVDSGELLTLSQAGVSSISTAYASESFVDLNGNTHQQTGSYLTTGGATRNANDVWFTKGPTANVNVSALSPGSAIAALPDLDGLGSVLSLHDAMVNDTAGHLQSLVSAFVNEPDPAVRAGLLDGLIFAWANVEAVNPSSRGTYFPDARKLTALEKFLGVSFVQGSGTNSGTGSPGPQATQVLLRAYDSIAALFGANLLAPTQHADLYAGSHLISDPVTHTLSWDISGTISALQAAYATDATRGAALMNEFASALKQLGDESALMLETLRKQGSVAASGFSYQLATMGYASVLTGTSNADTLTAQNGDDLVLGAAGADTLFGLGGDDEIQGGDGNDHLQGGLGNDVLIGGAGDDQLSGGDDAYYQTFPAQPINVGADGDDTFVYARGDGRDTIHEVGAVGWDKDPGRNDVIRFGAGVNVNDLVLTANSNRGTLTINFRDPGGSISTADSLTIEGYFLGDDFFRFDDASGDHHAIERSVATFRFDDTGAVYTAQELEELLLPANTTGDNFITGTSGDDVINGMGGKDTIYGGDGNDTIYASGETRLHGGSGNDFLKGTSWLFGNGGDDTLEGLSGSTVYGGEGSDTYLYNLGDGDVSIGDKSTFDSAAGAVDVLRFGPGIRPSDVVVKRATTVSNDDGAQFFVTNSLTRQRSIVTAYNALSVINGTSVLDEVRFDDGTVWTHEDLYARYLTGDVTPNIIQGFDRDDVIRGNGGDDTLRGGNGIDDLGGGAGNDELEGDAGDDTYRFGRGQGHDEIKDTQGFNRIVLDTGIAVGDVALTRTSTAVRFGASTADALVLTLNTGEELWLRDFFAGSATVGEIQFIDGTVWNAAQIAAHTVDQSGTAGTQNGTASDDTFVVDHRSDVINEPASSGTDTVVSSVSYTLPANIENLTLSGALGITGTGNTLDNTLTGNGGANVLDGGRGIDTLIGGLGDDTYVVDMDGSWPDTPQFYNFPGSRLQGFQDFVTELSGEGNDTLVAYHLYSVTLPDNIENLVIQGLTYGSISYNLTQDVRRKFTGNALDNVIDATFAEDVGVGIGDTFFGNGAGGEIVIDGGAGADTMIGAPLSERFIVDNVNDIVLNGNAGDTIESSVSYTLPSSVGILKLTGTAAIDATGTSATDSLVGNGANNILSGGGGNDLLDGGAGADTLDGGAGNDTLTGGTEADSMAGGVGDDLYSVDNSGDVVTEVADAGTDIVQSSINYLLGDNIENLTLTGGALSAIGNALDNVITGNGSSNVIDGGAGDDRLIGGAGADTYLNFGWGRGNDVITDTQGISAVRFATDQNIAADDLKFQRVGNDLRIGISGADSVTVQSWFTTAAANRVGSVTLSEGGPGLHLYRPANRGAYRRSQLRSGAQHEQSAWHSLHRGGYDAWLRSCTKRVPRHRVAALAELCRIAGGRIGVAIVAAVRCCHADFFRHASGRRGGRAFAPSHGDRRRRTIGRGESDAPGHSCSDPRNGGRRQPRGYLGRRHHGWPRR
ncbi:MAG: calcium-binding protein [Gammaproteobacteria bacterium]